MAAGHIKPSELITHVFDFDDALEGYNIIAGKTNEKYLAILLKYDVNHDVTSKIVLRNVGNPKTQDRSEISKVNVGVIGAGNFARGILLPKLKQIESANIKCIATASGLSAAYAGKKFGCEYVTSDYKAMVADPSIHAVFIATRHNLHTEMAVEGLSKGKYVFVEKPLAISIEQLDEILDAWRTYDGRIMVGFNRRFSRFARMIKEHFNSRTYPISINYRINAGPAPKDSWIQDPEQGGGRVIGEVCHFVDFLQYVVGSYPIRVYSEMLRHTEEDGDIIDSISSVLAFPDGSMGTINYLSNGDKRFPKERVEVFGGGSVCVIDDFMSAKIIAGGRTKKISGHQDKGHASEIREFIRAVKNNDRVPEDFREAVAVTITTFKILESAKDGLPKSMDIQLD